MIPVVGITMDTSPPSDVRSFGKGDSIYYQTTAYIRYLETVPCIPILLPTLPNHKIVQTIVARLDGIILSGGEDVAPAIYGQEPINPDWRMDGPRTYFEVELINQALLQMKPIFGICRGSQMLNVALGGDMYQDIPTQYDKAIEHTSKNKPQWTYHEVRVVKHSLLHSIVKVQRMEVTTSHHQAIKNLAKGIKVTATAADGMVEAIELPSENFVIGVQWHPEIMEGDMLQVKLLQAFVEACRLSKFSQ